MAYTNKKQFMLYLTDSELDTIKQAAGSKSVNRFVIDTTLRSIEAQKLTGLVPPDQVS